MKIGILTFHSQLNYGGILQCWALQTVLEKMGHEVVVIDRWIDSNNWHLHHGYDGAFFRLNKSFILRCLLGLGDHRFLLRVKRTEYFIKKRLHLTPYHFVEWKDAPDDLGVDMVVIGSDQVWNTTWQYSYFYLLIDAPKSLERISYAASVGMAKIPEHDIPLFIKALKKFKAISCREEEACQIFRSLGFEAKRVLDPTLLLGKTDWLNLIKKKTSNSSSGKKTLVCYFLAENIDNFMSLLNQFAITEHCRVKIFVIDLPRTQDLINFPSTLKKICKWIKTLTKRYLSHVTICESAGPLEFVKEYSNATWIITDSFHSLMFSIIFNKNCRVLRPKQKERITMFARIDEIAKHTKGLLITENVQSALNSFHKNEKIIFDHKWINENIISSKQFIMDNIN